MAGTRCSCSMAAGDQAEARHNHLHLSLSEVCMGVCVGGGGVVHSK